MNITIKITHANGTVMDISIPFAIETPKPVEVPQPAAVAEEEPQCSVEPDDIRPSGKAETDAIYHGPEVLEALKEALKDETEQLLSYEGFLAARKEDLKPSGKRYKSVQEMVEDKKDLYGEEALEFLKETIFTEPEQPQDTGEQFRCTDGFYAIPPNLYSDFCAAFGQTMVDQQLTLARLWVETNPPKRKTRRGMGRFLNAWMCRAQGEKRQPLKGRSGSLLEANNTSSQGW